MLRNDGLYTFYRIQHRHENGDDWIFSNLDRFGYPLGFGPSGLCWQQTGVYGTYDPELLESGLKWIHNHNPQTLFRGVVVYISQKTVPIT